MSNSLKEEWLEVCDERDKLAKKVMGARGEILRVEAACARALAGDQKDWRTLRATLMLVVQRAQEIRATLGAP